MKKINLVLGTFLVFGFLVAVNPQIINAGEKITICHATASESNPYNKLNVDKDSIVGGHGPNDGVHDNDIIPPFTAFPSGKNWDAAGQAIYNNNCKVTGKITVDKIVVGNEEVDEEDFKLYVGDNKVSDEEKNTFNAGTYTISEQPKEEVPTGYEVTFSGDCNSEGQITIGVGEEKTCTITNTYPPPQPPTGTLTIQKYDCPADFVPNRTDNGVGSQVPEGCTPQSGVGFEYTYDPNNDTNNTGPYLGLFGDPTPFSPLAPTNEAGLSINPEMSSPGRYIVRETDPTNLLGLYCVGDGDTNPNNNDNQEITFVPEGNTAINCVAYNKELEPPPQCKEGEQWAYEIVSSAQGTRKDGSGVLASRTNPTSVLGVPDGNGTAGTGFFSLGKNGTITVKFNHFIENVSGDDLYFYEITNGRSTYPEELAEVEVSQDGSTWFDIGTVSSKPTGIGSLDFDSTGLDWIMFVRVTDVTNFSLHSNDADGYDLDAIKAANGLCEEPIFACRVEVVSAAGDEGVGNGDAVLAFVHSAWTTGLNSFASWIWDSYHVENPHLTESKTFTKDFFVDGPVQDASLSLAADNRYLVEINDTEVASNTGEFNYSSVTGPLNVASAVTPGWNTITMKIENIGLSGYEERPEDNPAAGIYRLVVNSGAENSCVPPPVLGCTDPEALNYNPKATEDDDSCEYPTPTATISAVKIVCPTENLLPNWGNGGADITSTTASDFISANPSCSLVPWEFEWAPDGTTNPGDSIEDHASWTNFSSTAVIPAGSRVWVREHFDSNYIPFSGSLSEPRNNVSAEFYCHTDVLNYDNYDFINPVVAGNTYHCVAWNVPIAPPPQCELPMVWNSQTELCEAPDNPPLDLPQCSDNIDNDGDGQTDYPNDPGCDGPEDDSESPNPQSQPPQNPPTTSGNGGGSRSGDFRGGGGSVAGASTGAVLGQSCGLYMDRFIRFGSRFNDVEQVKLLQAFLNKWMGSTLEVSGVYDSATLEVLNAFQTRYAAEILTPWNLTSPTGLVYQTTLRWINMLECPDLALAIPSLIEWSKNPNVPKEPLASSAAPASTPAAPKAQTEPEGEAGNNDDEEFNLNSLQAGAGAATEGGGGGIINFLKKLFGR